MRGGEMPPSSITVAGLGQTRRMRAELGRMLTAAVESVAAEPKQEALSFALREQPVAYISPVKPVEACPCCC